MRSFNFWWIETAFTQHYEVTTLHIHTIVVFHHGKVTSGANFEQVETQQQYYQKLSTLNSELVSSFSRYRQKHFLAHLIFLLHQLAWPLGKLAYCHIAGLGSSSYSPPMVIGRPWIGAIKQQTSCHAGGAGWVSSGLYWVMALAAASTRRRFQTGLWWRFNGLEPPRKEQGFMVVLYIEIEREVLGQTKGRGAGGDSRSVGLWISSNHPLVQSQLLKCKNCPLALILFPLRSGRVGFLWTSLDSMFEDHSVSCFPFFKGRVFVNVTV